MRLLLLLPSLLLFSLPIAHSSSGPIQTHTLAYEPLTATATPIPLAILTSSPPAVDDTPTGASSQPRAKADLHPAYTIKSYTPPSASTKTTPLLRIGLLLDKKLVGSTTVARLSALHNPDSSLLKLLLDPQGEVFGVSWHLHPLPAAEEQEPEGKHRANAKEAGKPTLLVVGPAPETRPVLNKPVVLNEQGRVEEPEQPKTLLQRYWWVGAALLVMTLAGGGGE